MAHNPEFLKLVNDAKARVQEIDLAGYRKMREAGETHVLVDTREESEWAAGHVAGAVHLGKGIIERDIETKVPDRTRSWCCTAAADSAPRWWPTICGRWATRTRSPSMADGARSRSPGWRWRNRWHKASPCASERSSDSPTESPWCGACHGSAESRAFQAKSRHPPRRRPCLRFGPHRPSHFRPSTSARAAIPAPLRASRAACCRPEF